MKRKFALGLIMLFCVSFVFAGCNEVRTGTVISSSVEEVNVRLEESLLEGGEPGTASFVVKVDNFENSHIAFRIENEGVLQIIYERKTSQYDVTVKGLKAGQAKVVAYLAEDSSIQKEILVNVIQPIKNLQLVNNYIHYVAIGSGNAIKPSESMVITPIDGNISEIKYALVENPANLNVTVDETTGYIDTSEVDSAGEIVVRAFINSEIFQDIPVKVVKSVTKDDVTITRTFINGSEPIDIFANGEIQYDNITMVKTIEYYSEMNLDIAYSNDIINEVVDVTVSGNSIKCDSHLSSNKLIIRAVGLGKSEITLKFNIKNAQGFVTPLILTFTIKVIESPYDININGESSQENDNQFTKTIYNRYASGDYGLSIRFTLSPSSVLEENADIVISFENKTQVQNNLLILNSKGERLGAKLNATGHSIDFEDFVIKSGETIYIKSTAQTVIPGTQYRFSATALITETFNTGNPVKTNVTLNVMEGLSRLTTDRNKYYVERDDETGATVNLNVGNVVGDTSAITYKVSNDNIAVSKISNLEYRVVGLKNGESDVVFDSNNGHVVTVRFVVYGRLSSVVVTSDSKFTNSSIGKIVLDGTGSLSHISAKIKGGFGIGISTNADATVGQVKFVVDETGKKYVNISNNYVSILGVGKAIVTAYIYGYNEYGLVEEHEAIKKSFEVEGYVPISSIALSHTNITLKDIETVGVSNVAKYSQVKLNLTVYPSNAVVNQGDIEWQCLGSSGSITEIDGYSRLVTAGPIQGVIQNDSFVVSVRVTQKDRIYTESCVINVERAEMVNEIKFANVFNGEIFFDARNGLATLNEDGSITSTNNYYQIEASAYPNYAFNKNLIYTYIKKSDDTNPIPVFDVDRNGKVMPIRGGVATLQVIAEDGYKGNSGGKVYRDIKIVVADGLSAETAYRISTSQELIEIGDNEQSRALNYVLANDIDVSSYTNWTPICTEAQPFTGRLSGKMVIGTNDLEIVSKIKGLKIEPTNAQLQNGIYNFGLFGVIMGGEVADLQIECAKFSLNASNKNIKINMGVLAGKIDALVDEQIYSITDPSSSKISNCSVVFTSNNANNYVVNTALETNVGGFAGTIMGGTIVTFNENGSAVNIDKLQVNYGVNDTVNVGGFAGEIRANLINLNAKGIYGAKDVHITGGYERASIVNNSIIYKTNFNNSGNDVVIGSLSVNVRNDLTVPSGDNTNKVRVGGFIGFANIEQESQTIEIEEGNIEDELKQYFTYNLTKEQISKLFTIENIAVSANIITGTNCVGGLVGFNEYNLENVYFTGSIEAVENVGGIAGYNMGTISKAIVENATTCIVNGSKNVGGIIGYNDGNSTTYTFFAEEKQDAEHEFEYNLSGNVLFSFVTSASTNELIIGTQNVGTIIGNMQKGEIIGSYSDLLSSSSLMVGTSNDGVVQFSFIINGEIGCTASNSYYVNGANTDYNETDLLSSQFEEQTIWVKPGTTIGGSNGEGGILIDERINDGKLIICLPNELPLYNVIYETMNITVKENINKYLKVDDKKVVLFLYKLDPSFENSIPTNKKYELRQQLSTNKQYNVVSLNELFNCYVSPTPFSNVRIKVNALTANGNESSIVRINADGTMTLLDEGLVVLEFVSVANPELKARIQVYITNFVSAFKLYKGTNANSIEYDNNILFELRKNQQIDVFAKILSELDDVTYAENNSMGLTIEMLPTEEDSQVEITVNGGVNTYKTVFNVNRYTVNGQKFNVSYYILVDGEKKFATLDKENNRFIFESLDPNLLEQNFSVDEQAGLTFYEVYYNNVSYEIKIDKFTMDIDKAGVLSFLSDNAYYNKNVTIKPFFNVEYLDESNNKQQYKIYPDNTKINQKTLEIRIYEGAIQIDSSIESVMYSPSDTITFQVTFVADTEKDTLNDLTYGKIVDGVFETSNAMEITKILTSEPTLNNLDGKYYSTYEISVSIKDDFASRYFEEAQTYQLTMSSTFLEGIEKTINLTFEPQVLQRLDVLNYTNGEVRIDENNEYVFNRNEVASLYVSANSNGLLNVNMYPYYSKVDMVTIESVEVEGQTISLSQVVLNEGYENNGFYSSLIPRSQYTQDGKALILQKYSVQNTDVNTKTFNGNFYVRTLISSELLEGTVLPVIVKAFNYDDNGALVQVSEKVINLIVKEIPFVKVELANQSSTNYVVRGTMNDILVTMGRTFSGQKYRVQEVITRPDSASVLEDDSVLSTVIHCPTNEFEIVKGREVYKDQLYVGIGLPAGTQIDVHVSVDYLENGISRTVQNKITLKVVDYLINDVELYSFNNESNYLKMTTQEKYELGVSKLDFISAPTYDKAKSLFSTIVNVTEDDKYQYNSYYYGYVKRGNDTFPVAYENGYYKLLGNSPVPTELSGNFKYNYDFELIDVATEKTIAELSSENEATYFEGLDIKKGRLENSLRYNLSKFTKNVNGSFQSIETKIQQNSKFYVEQESQNPKKTYLIGLSVSSGHQLRFTVKYGIDENCDFVVYDDENLPSTYLEFQKTYSFNIVSFSARDVPLPIYNQADFENMSAGEHYIQMNDIVLTNYTPFSTAIASFDGNGYSIDIRTFNNDSIDNKSVVELGLFSTVQENTIIKNVCLNVRNLGKIDLTTASTVSVGLFAVNNNGIITNCEISVAQSSQNTSGYEIDQVVNGVEVTSPSDTAVIDIITNSIMQGTETIVNVAGFVCNNNSDISNCRIGEDNNSFLSIKAIGNVAGFVNENNGHISASYVRNIYLTNSNPYATNSITAGFAGKNQGTIITSYVKGGDFHNSSTGTGNSIRCKDGTILSNGNIGGFIYQNNGKISDSYSNIKILSNARTAGFVFINGQSGTISSSYSTSTITKQNAMHSPFIGVDEYNNPNSQNPDGFAYCYFLQEKPNDYDTSSTVNGVNSLVESDFADEKSFSNFSFSKAGILDSIWTLEAGCPELVDANKKSQSSRILVQDEQNASINYIYGNNSHLGTKNNPYLIANAEDFNYYFNSTYNPKDKIVENKYFRLISDVDFNEVVGDVMTLDVSLCGVLIDGNGFTLSNIRINSLDNNGVESIGLFKKIYSKKNSQGVISQYSTIKSLNLEITEANALNCNFLGGLAGIVEDSYLLNINVTSSSIMQSYNVAGGLVGMISGESQLSSITSSASVQAVYKATTQNDKPLTYAETENFKKISHVGAVAGIVDMKTDLSFEELSLEDNAQVTNIKVEGKSTVSGEYAGGVFGFVGANTNIANVAYELAFDDVENKQQIYTTYCAGGIVAVNFGIVTYAQISHKQDRQVEVDANIYNYLRTGTRGNFGKTNLFNGTMWYVGGIVGINYGGIIKNAYSRADIIDNNIRGDLQLVKEQYFGGLIGVSYGGELISAYATSTVVTKVGASSYAGGLIGRLNELSGSVILRPDENGATSTLETKQIVFGTLYALNLWDKAYTSTIFREGGKYVGAIIGYIPNTQNIYKGSGYFKVENQQDSSSLFYANQVLYSGNGIFYEENGGLHLGIVGTDLYEESGQGTENEKLKFSKYEIPESSNRITVNDIYDISSQTISKTQQFFNALLTFSSSEVWEREWGQYPTLHLGKKSDNVDIKTAQELIENINQAPYKTFKILNDIDFSGTNSFITKVFTGKIVSGKKINDEDDAVNFYNIDPSGFVISNDSAGFFMATKRATFSNINFFVNEKDLSGTSVRNFGLITAEDEASSFNNVSVFVVKENIVKENTEYDETGNIRTIRTIEQGTITINSAVFGGLIGSETGSSVLNNCSFSGVIDVHNTASSNQKVTVGGLIGSGTIVKLINNTRFGGVNKTVNMQFPIYDPTIEDVIVNEEDNANFETGYFAEQSNIIVSHLMLLLNELYLGGMVGEVNSMLTLKNSNVVALDNCVNKIKLLSDINIREDASAYIGGIAGNIESGSIRNGSANIDIEANFNPTYAYIGSIAGRMNDLVMNDLVAGSASKPNVLTFANVNKTQSQLAKETIFANIGGVAGFAKVSTMNGGNLINTTTIYTNIDVTAPNASTYAVGGVYGEFNNTLEGGRVIENNSINVLGTIKVKQPETNSSGYKYVGGLIGNNVLTSGSRGSNTTIQYAFTNLDIYVDASRTNYIGGLVGNASNLKSIDVQLGKPVDALNGAISIYNSLPSGYIEIADKNSSIQKLYAGGVSGYSRGEIQNSIIATTIVRPNYNPNNFDKYHIGLVGGDFANGIDEVKGNNFNVAELTGLQYLHPKSFEVPELNSVVNVANKLTEISYSELIENIKAGNENENMIYKFVLPFLNEETREGSLLNPIYVTELGDISSANKKQYYILNEDIAVNTVSSILLKSVFAGNGHTITTSKTIFNEIDKYAIASNFKIVAQSLGNSALTSLNKGIINNVYATGTITGNNLGGLVTTNNGLISNVVVDIKIEGDNVGMLAMASANGIIFNCFTLGSIVGGVDYVGAVVGTSENTAYTFVNTATSFNTELDNENAGFLGQSNNENMDKFRYSSFDAQSLARNSLPTSNTQLKALEYAQYFNGTTNSSGSPFYLLNFGFDKTKNYGHPFPKTLEKFVKNTIDENGVVHVNNFSKLYYELNRNNVAQSNLEDDFNLVLDYDINQLNFAVKDVTKNNKKVAQMTWNPNGAKNFHGTFNGQGNSIKGVILTTQGIKKGTKTDYLTGFFNSITAKNNGEKTTIYNLNLEIIPNFTQLQEFQRKQTLDSINNVSNAYNFVSGVLAGAIFDSEIENVTVAFTDKDYTLYGNMVGGFAGYAENTIFNNCNTDGIQLKSFTMYYKAHETKEFITKDTESSKRFFEDLKYYIVGPQGIVADLVTSTEVKVTATCIEKRTRLKYKEGLVGGIVGKGNLCTFNNCVNGEHSVLESAKGMDGKELTSIHTSGRTNYAFINKDKGVLPSGSTLNLNGYKGVQDNGIVDANLNLEDNVVYYDLTTKTTTTKKIFGYGYKKTTETDTYTKYYPLNGLNSAPVAGISAYATNCNFNGCENKGELKSGNVGLGFNGKNGDDNLRASNGGTQRGEIYAIIG